MDFSLADTLRAYRQAKAALLEERSGIYATPIATFESDLSKNIIRLHELMVEKRPAPIRFGKVIALPKRNIERKLVLQAQLQQSLEAAVQDVAWLWTFGALIEHGIPTACASNRLKIGAAGVKKWSRYVYEPWKDSYERFHRDVRAVAQETLRRGSRCSICTFDIKEYYDSVDTRFLLDDRYVAELRTAAKQRGVPFDRDDYLRQTNAVLARGSQYQKAVATAYQVSRRDSYGLPIGAIASRLIANAALAELDRYVGARQGVLHYARWVDDIVVVLDDRASAEKLRIAKSLFPMKSSDELDSELLRRPKSLFRLNLSKTRLFALEGEEGEDLLASVSAEVDSVGSFRGTFGAALDRHEQRAELLEIVRQPHGRGEGAFQYVDGLKVRRAAASALIAKSVEATRLTLDAPDEHANTPLRALARTLRREREWVDFSDIVFRMLGAAIVSGDADLCGEVLTTIDSWIDRTERAKLVYVGRTKTHVATRSAAVEWLRERVHQVIATAISPVTASKPSWMRPSWNWTRIRTESAAFRSSDLRILDREDDFRWTGSLAESLGGATSSHVAHALKRDFELIEQFIGVSKKANDPVYGSAAPIDIWLSKQAPSVFDISWRWARAGLEPSVPPIEVVNAVRGTEYKVPIAQETKRGRRVSIVPVCAVAPKPHIRVALANMVTESRWFEAALKGKPIAGSGRLRPLIRVLESARRLVRGREHLMLVLPELSTPRSALRPLVQSLLREGIGLVAGLEYERHGKQVLNEVVAVIPRDFGLSVTVLWRKGLPAVGDESLHLKAEGVRLRRPDHPAGSVVLDSQFGAIGVLICSEMLEVKARSRLVGRVDSLLVPCWNTDTTSFEQLIQGASLDLHCFVGVANNAEYSDSRMRGPIGDRNHRDMCRLIERGEDTVVSAVTEVERLRAFQQGKISVGFKPIPPGFRFARPVRDSAMRDLVARILRKSAGAANTKRSKKSRNP